MKVLLIASVGQIREALVEQLTLRGRQFDVVGTQWFSPDSCDSEASLTVPADIDVVINTLSLECLEQLADESLVQSLTILAQACERAGVPILMLSNSQVFDGIDGGRHRELDQVVPASRVGALLSRMETLLAECCSRYIIVRAGPIFSSVGDNLLTTLLTRFQRGEQLHLSSSGKSCPVHAKDLARVLSAIVDQLSCGCESWGTYHYCSSDPATSYQFGETVLAVASQFSSASEQSLLLEPIDTADTYWPRPLLKCENILNTFGIKQLPWRSFVVPTVKKFFESEVVKEI